MTEKPFHEVWGELEDAGFFSLKQTTVLPEQPTGGKIDELCRNLASNNEFSSTLSYFESNLDICVGGGKHGSGTEFHVSSSRPFWSKEFGIGGSSDKFFGDGETFEDAIRDLYAEFIADEDAFSRKPVHIKTEDGVVRLVGE